MTQADTLENDRFATLIARAGRDDGKLFRISEVPPLDFATFFLRLLSALSTTDADNLLALLHPAADAPDDEAIRAVLGLLAGCDASAVRALITDALAYVQVAADPRHPGMFRPVNATDIKEMATLGQVLGAFARLNFTPAG